MNAAFLSIGSNMGNRLIHLQEAVRALDVHEQVTVATVSSIYETAPVGFTEQANFLNIVVKVETTLEALSLLDVCQEIEKGQGRKREVRWGPRTVDLDILLYNNARFETERLIIPHPRMRDRAFVLIPLLEIAPSITEPVSRKPFSEESAVHDGGVSLWKKVDGIEQFLLLGA